MSQKSVEMVVGRLATSGALRRRFEFDRAALLDAFAAQGLAFSPVERSALLELDCSAFERFARRLDQRIQTGE